MLEINHLSYKYGEIAAIEDLTFRVEREDCLCVAGMNGSGKSTLLQLIATSLKPTSGDILLDGVSIYSDLPSTRRKIGLIFQNPDDQLFMPAVWEDVAYGVLNKGVKLAESKALAMDALEKVHASHLAERVPHRLSCGEKYRVAIASVMIMNPEILILDEPTAALDPNARRNVIQLLLELRCTRIIATHDLDMARGLCNRRITLERGTIPQTC